MKAIIKYIEEEFTVPEIVGGKLTEVKEKGNALHAIIDGEDRGEIVNIDEHNYKEGEEVNVEEFEVCPDCYDESECNACVCWYQKYKPIKVLKAVCKCCEHILS